MKAKLGMSPIAWWNDDLVELSDDVSLEECLRQSRSAGFTGMEKGRRFPDDPAVMLPILKAADVTLCGGWFSGTLVDELVDRFGKKSRDRGVRVAVESENRMVVELSVILEYGVNIPEVCGQLQEEVRKSIEKMTGKSVQAVNVSVQSLRRPPHTAQEETT